MAIVATNESGPLIAAILELAEYLGEHPCVTAFNVGNSFYTAREEWRERDPKTPIEIVEYYRKTGSLLHQLVFANYGIPHELTLFERAREIFTDCNDVLDLGAGIGSLLLGLTCPNKFHADVGGELFEYAAWRYRQANQHQRVTMIQLHDDYVERDTMGLTFDGVVCTEVLEHVPDPIALVAYLSKLVRPGGKLLATVSFDDGDGMVPQHLNVEKWTDERFIAEVFPAHGFERVDEDLYVRDKAALIVRCESTSPASPGSSAAT